MEIEPVIFRVWKGTQDVIAIFPEIMSNPDPYSCQMYEHVGQHGGGDPQGVIQRTRPAKLEEYSPLLAELEGRGYRLRVIKRYRHKSIDVRRKQIQGVS